MANYNHQVMEVVEEQELSKANIEVMKRKVEAV